MSELVRRNCVYLHRVGGRVRVLIIGILLCGTLCVYLKTCKRGMRWRIGNDTCAGKRLVSDLVDANIPLMFGINDVPEFVVLCK